DRLLPFGDWISSWARIFALPCPAAYNRPAISSADSAGAGDSWASSPVRPSAATTMAIFLRLSVFTSSIRRAALFCALLSRLQGPAWSQSRAAQGRIAAAHHADRDR